ncbi:MAG: phosphoribosylamine--glycine ligase [Poseidonia sp.]|jgi:phosphoribosylamine--glycine ligase
MEKATVVVIGSGGREHAFCLALDASPRVGELHCIPGNAGTALLATNHAVSIHPSELMPLLLDINPDLVVVGPEAPLCEGLADACAEHRLPCFGPVAALAHLEGSKLHAKETMEKAGVPTAAYLRLDAASDVEAALDRFAGEPWVVKRDVLAGGKGVVVTEDRNEARTFIERSIESDGFVLLEAFLAGEEASMLVVMDGTAYRTLPASQDHKRAYDGDQGPNTGGMGAYCPAPVVSPDVHQRVVERIVEPMHRHLSSQDVPYRGVLFVGLMIDQHGDPYVVEFNVRFGDPECQVTLPLVKTDLYTLLHAAASDALHTVELALHDGTAVTVVLASEGYPATPVKGRPIRGLEALERLSSYGTSWVNFAGVGRNHDGDLIASGGRVLSATAMGDDLASTQRMAYELMGQLSLEGGHFRSDIAHRAIR